MPLIKCQTQIKLSFPQITSLMLKNTFQDIEMLDQPTCVTIIDPDFNEVAGNLLDKGDPFSFPLLCSQPPPLRECSEVCKTHMAYDVKRMARTENFGLSDYLFLIWGQKSENDCSYQISAAGSGDVLEP